MSTFKRTHNNKIKTESGNTYTKQMKLYCTKKRYGTSPLYDSLCEKVSEKDKFQ